jgi:hypothetical protein
LRKEGKKGFFGLIGKEPRFNFIADRRIRLLENHDMGLFLAPRPRANIGLKRKEKPKCTDIDLPKRWTIERRILSIWISLWIILLMGIVTIPLAVCEIAQFYMLEKEIIGNEKERVLRRKGGKGLQNQQSPQSRFLRIKRYSAKSYTLFRKVKMDPSTWHGEKFSQTREPEHGASSSPPVLPEGGLTPQRRQDLDAPSIYESDGEGAGITPRTRGTDRSNLPPPVQVTGASRIDPSERFGYEGVPQTESVFGGPRGRMRSTDGPRGREEAVRDLGGVGEGTRVREREPMVMNLVQALPLPNMPGAPRFEGKDVTAFVQSVQDLFDDCKTPLRDRRVRLVRYCAPEIRGKVERMPEYQEERFQLNTFYKALRLQYRDRDSFQQKYTIRKLDEIVRDGCKLPEGRLEEYLDMFHDISEELAERGILSRYDRGVKFMRGLPPHLRTRVGERHHFNPLDPESVDYAQYYQTAQRIYTDRKNIQELNEDTSSAKEEAQHPLQHGTATKSQSARKDGEEELVRQFMGLKVNLSEVKSHLHEVASLRREVEGLRIQLEERPSDRTHRNQVVDPRIREHRGRGGVLPTPWGNHEIGVNAYNQRSGYSSGRALPRDQWKCYMCGNEPGPGGQRFPDHSHVRDCPIYGQFFQIGTCWYDSDNEDPRARGLYWGKSYEKGMRIRCNRESPYWRQVVEMSKGTAYDVNLQDREAYFKALRDTYPKMDANSFSRVIPGQDEENSSDSNTANVRAVDVWGGDFQEPGRITYEELAVTLEEEQEHSLIANVHAIDALDSNAVVTRSKAKGIAEGAREILQRRQLREAKFARAKHPRHAAIVQEEDEAEDVEMGEPLFKDVGLEEGDLRGVVTSKAVRFVEGHNDLSEVPAIAATSAKSHDQSHDQSHDPGTPRRKGSYNGLTSAYSAGDILLDHFANAKLDITVAQYLATSKEGRDFLAKGLKEVNTPEVKLPRDRCTVDANLAFAREKTVRQGQNAEYYGLEEPGDAVSAKDMRVYPSPHIPVTIFGPRNATRIAVMLDTGADVNIMSRALSDKLGMKLQSAADYDMRPIRGPQSGMHGVVDEVEIKIGPLSFEVSFFVVEDSNHHCLLGQPFFMQTGIVLNNTRDGMCGPQIATLHDPKSKKTIRIRCAKPLPRKVVPARTLLEENFNSDSEHDSGKE